MDGETDDGRRRFGWLAAAFCVALTAPRLLAHELWRDEAWLWLVVTDSDSLGELIESLARSGQGYLFPLLCYQAKAISPSALTMQGLHLALAAAGAFAVARWAPFDRAERALFVLGYMPFYEYAVLSRHYALGGLLLWLACAAARARWPPWILGAALALLCQTTVYGFILATAVAGGWLADRWLRRAELAPPQRQEVAAGAAIFAAGAVAGLVQLIPAPGTSFATGWRFGWHPAILERVLQMPWRAFVPLPRPELHFWNTNVLDAWPTVQAAGGILLLAGAVACLRRRRPALLALLLGAAGFAAFGYVKFVGALRHDGHWWLLLAAALWLAGGLERAADGRRTWAGRAFLALLVVQVVAGVYASWMDLRHPFSNAGAAARLLRAQGLDRLPLLGYREPPAASVSLALGQPLFAPSRGVYTRYPDWGPEQRELSLAELRCAARAFAGREGGDVVLVLNRELPPWDEVEPAGAAVGAIQLSEDYHLYRLHHERLTASATAAACPRP
jgi:hypothetical protein